MTTRNFQEMVQQKWNEGKYLCVGLDSDVRKLPPSVSGQVFFNQGIIEATRDLVCAYKPNMAFYEVLGSAGISNLQYTINLIHEQAPGVPVILDGKRNDIGNTCEAYAEAGFDTFDADAVTTNPYLGTDGLEPFLKRPEKGVFVLCKTSNKSAGELQDLKMADGRPLFLHVAELAVKKWNGIGNCGLVVGATYPEQMTQVRFVAPRMPLLIPGIGTQGGDLEATIKAAHNWMIINASSLVIFAYRQEKHKGITFQEAARIEAKSLHDNIKKTIIKVVADEAMARR